jgi:hypothetical protein
MMKWINLLFQKYFRSKWKGSRHIPLEQYALKVFKDNGEGLYYANIWSRNNTFLAKVIGYFSKGISHTVPIFYSENLREQFTLGQWGKISASWAYYYRRVVGENTKCLCWSAEDIGLVAIDWSKYQKRKVTIRKIRTGNQKKILTYLVDKIGRPYDSIGLVMWLFKLQDDPYSFHCSDITHKAMLAGNIHIADIADTKSPSPAQIEAYNKGWIVYSQEAI